MRESNTPFLARVGTWLLTHWKGLFEISEQEAFDLNVSAGSSTIQKRPHNKLNMSRHLISTGESPVDQRSLKALMNGKYEAGYPWKSVKLPSCRYPGITYTTNQVSGFLIPNQNRRGVVNDVQAILMISGVPYISLVKSVEDGKTLLEQMAQKSEYVSMLFNSKRSDLVGVSKELVIARMYGKQCQDNKASIPRALYGVNKGETLNPLFELMKMIEKTEKKPQPKGFDEMFNDEIFNDDNGDSANDFLEKIRGDHMEHSDDQFDSRIEEEDFVTAYAWLHASRGGRKRKKLVTMLLVVAPDMETAYDSIDRNYHNLDREQKQLWDEVTSNDLRPDLILHVESPEMENGRIINLTAENSEIINRIHMEKIASVLEVDDRVWVSDGNNGAIECVLVDFLDVPLGRQLKINMMDDKTSWIDGSEIICAATSPDDVVTEEMIQDAVNTAAKGDTNV